MREGRWVSGDEHEWMFTFVDRERLVFFRWEKPGCTKREFDNARNAMNELIASANQHPAPPAAPSQEDIDREILEFIRRIEQKAQPGLLLGIDGALLNAFREEKREIMARRNH